MTQKFLSQLPIACVLRAAWNREEVSWGSVMKSSGQTNMSKFYVLSESVQLCSWHWSFENIIFSFQRLNLNCIALKKKKKEKVASSVLLSKEVTKKKKDWFCCQKTSAFHIQSNPEHSCCPAHLSSFFLFFLFFPCSRERLSSSQELNGHQTIMWFISLWQHWKESGMFHD